MKIAFSSKDGQTVRQTNKRQSNITQSYNHYTAMSRMWNSLNHFDNNIRTPRTSEPGFL